MKKKAFIILICITALLAGCQNTKTDIANDISTDAGSTSTHDEDIASIGISNDGDGDGSLENQWIFGKGFSSWQEGYKAYIETAPDFPRYSLIYVDDDDIPELAIEGYCEAEGCLIVSFHHGEVNILHTLRLGFSYIEKKGLLCNSNGCQGQYYDIVYSLSEGKWKCIFSGSNYTHDFGSLDDEAGKFLDFHYAIDDVEVDEKTYYEKLNKIYDEKAAIYSFCDGCNKEEFITALSEY
ncbi:hypothetical protein [Butyrivibrio sp. AE2005]|uniref:hypothetical protein n=1 Tax=Butyrivibrio sp. AE2005 TaxID=1496722 RepID=UPI00047AB495|nr:hypothetical protein [Butyrivibrio sp. AE2005]